MSFTGRIAFYAALAAMPNVAVAQEETPKAERFAHCGGFLEGAAFDEDGLLWVVDLLGGGIFSVDAEGQCTKRGETGGAPNGARFHRDGRLFITDNKLGIIAVDTKSMKQSVIVDNYHGDPITTANDLAFDARGGIYFTDPRGSTYLNRTGRVFYLPPDAGGEGAGNALQLVADNLIFPNGIAVSDDGQHVLVGQLRDKTILKLPTVDSDAVFKGAHVHVRTTSGMGPDGLALDSEGAVYWAQFEGSSIGSANSYGQIMQEFSLGEKAGGFVTNVAFQGGCLYATEAEKGEIWRINLGKEGQTLLAD